MSAPLRVVSTLVLLICVSQVASSQSDRVEDRAKKALTNFQKVRNPNRVLRSLDSLGDLNAIGSDSLKAAVFYYKGSALGQINKFDSSLFYLEKSLALLKDKGYSELEVFNAMAFGNVFWARQYVSLALEYYQKGLDISTQMDGLGYRQLETLLLNNIGGVYGKMEDFENALKFSMRANDNLLANDASGKAPRNYLKLGTYLNALSRPDEALQKLVIGEKQAIEIGDSIALSHIHDAMSLSYLAQKKFNEAETYGTKSLKDAEALKYKFASPYFSLASVYNARRNFIAGKEYAARGSALADELGDVNEKKKAIDLFYQIALGEKNYASALSYLNQVNSLNDSIKSIARIKQVEEIQTRYETGKKEQQIKELAQANVIKDIEAASARQRQVFMVIGLVLLVVTVAVLYNRNQLKQRTARILDEKNVQLQKLNGFKDRMFAVISHDLRNPVDAFGTIIESLNQNLQHASKEQLKEFLESTLDSAKDLKSLLNNLLEWSLVQIGKLPFDPRPLELNEVIAESLSHVDSMATIKNISIVNGTGFPRVMADKSMITIIARNLISNAIRYSEPGKSIQLNSFARNGSIVLSVKDEGIGMKAEDLSKLFKQEENVRTIGSSVAKGAGIGLLLCKELTDKNGGKIYAESEPGKGSTFYLELPAA